MSLYLIRHGEAVPETMDTSRPLTEKGILDISEITAFLNAAEVKVNEIWHSTKLRAKQTAKIIAEGVPHKKLIERDNLLPNDTVRNIAGEITAIHEDIVIVGHLPFLEHLATYLLSKNENFNFVNFSQGGVICLEKIETGWTILWMMTPALLSACIEHVEG
ncbi:phosphohistidine phosphatase SixA [Candidatus Saganbacteria bacterium]|nr:phosphohistidine phosphatase SixA [Candidatus Saganbacteria bacterium]